MYVHWLWLGTYFLFIYFEELWVIITNALDMFNSLFDKKLESNYLWSFKLGIHNKTTYCFYLRGSWSFNIVPHTTETNTHTKVSSTCRQVAHFNYLVHPHCTHLCITISQPVSEILCKHSDWRDNTLTCAHTDYNL